jgi:inhibitor of KinA
MTLAPLGDQAVLVYLPDEPAAVRFAAAVRAADPPWLEDVVPAYASVGVFFDADRVTFREVEGWVKALDSADSGSRLTIPDSALSTQHSARVQIPVCYDFQLDLARVAGHTGLSPERVIELHTSAEYTVYAVGFVPGFPYLGYLPDALCGVPRLATPRVRVEAGSVGLTGRQTGLYPLARPGGWNILGRTPLVVVDVADGFFPLRVGDRVRFTRIDAAEFRRLDGRRLEALGRM